MIDIGRKRLWWNQSMGRDKWSPTHSKIMPRSKNKTSELTCDLRLNVKTEENKTKEKRWKYKTAEDMKTNIIFHLVIIWFTFSVFLYILNVFPISTFFIFNFSFKYKMCAFDFQNNFKNVPFFQIHNLILLFTLSWSWFSNQKK